MSEKKGNEKLGVDKKQDITYRLKQRLKESPVFRKRYFETRLAKFARYYLREHVQSIPGKLHREWYSLLQNTTKDIALACPREHAKAQSLDSNVLTTQGWISLRSLTSDDKIFGKDGNPKSIIELKPITEMDLYRVSTRDGRSTLCNLEHLWTVTCPSNTGNRKITVPLKQILKNYKSERYDKRVDKNYVEYRYFLDTCEPIRFNAKDLLIDPYTLGVWLGDGASRDARIYSDDSEIINYIPYPTKKLKAKFSYGISDLRWRLRSLGLVLNKHIPAIYLESSVKQRIELLRGLMDTDGTVSTDGKQFSFTQKNEQLMRDVIELIRSLGGTTTLGVTRANINGKVITTQRITARIGFNPFKLRRKYDFFKGSIKTKSAIVSIKYEKTDLGRCISVEDDHYITDDYMVTHNSTTFSLVFVLWCILYKKKKFILMISDTIDQAELLLGSIVEELETNKRIIRDFGHIAGDIPSSMKEKQKWTTKDITTTTGVKVIGRGWKSKLRGLKKGAQRPDLIIGDDLENDEQVESDTQRAKLRRIFDKSISNVGTKGTRIVIIGTILHFDSLLQNLINTPKPNWFTKLYKAIENDQPIWGEWWDIERLMNKKAQIGSIAFEQEFMNNPLDEGQQILKFIGFYDSIDLSFCDCFAYLDLASREKEEGVTGKKSDPDYCAIVTIARDRRDGLLYAIDPQRMRGKLGEILNWFFEYYKKYNHAKIGIESNNFQEWFFQLADERSRLEGLYIPMMPIEQIKDKVTRAKSVSVYFENQTIKSNKNYIDLNSEVEQFPKAAHDDLVDSAVEGIKLAMTWDSGGGGIRTGANRY